MWCVAERTGIEIGRQLLQNHGRISNITGIVGAYFGLDTGSSVWGSELYAGLNLAESASRNKHQLNALDWTTFATSALDGFFGTVKDTNGVMHGDQYFNKSGFNWTMLAREALFTGARTIAAETVANDRRYQNQDIVGNTLASGLGGIAGNIIGQSPGFQRSAASVGNSLAGVEESIARGWSGLTNTVADTYNNVTSLFNLNTTGESLTNSALAQADGAQGGVLTAPAPWPAQERERGHPLASPTQVDNSLPANNVGNPLNTAIGSPGSRLVFLLLTSETTHPHQSPIGIKAVGTALSVSPRRFRAPQNTQYHTVSKTLITESVVRSVDRPPLRWFAVWANGKTMADPGVQSECRWIFTTPLGWLTRAARP